ncbi:MAG: Flp pilus assembly complex ATPase component TadA [Deltaproteobacteria bacterium]|nr:Flp pilus assembly complex ATPase component TadA [Deltaproteobacteria bacterium]
MNHNELFLDTINQVQLAIKSTGVYPEDHPITVEIINNSYEALVKHLKDKNMLTFGVNGGKLLVDDDPIETKNNLPANFSLDLDQRAIESISFYRGMSRRDYMTFIKAMIQNPRSTGKDGSVAAALKNGNVSTIRLNEFKYRKVSKDFKEDEHGHIINAFDIDDEKPLASANAGMVELDQQDHENRGYEPVYGKSSSEDEEIHDAQKREPLQDVEGPVHEYIKDLLSCGKSHEMETYIEEVSSKMDNKSITMRKRVAESLEHVTSTLEEFDTLKEKFQKTSDTLTNWLKKEHHVDTYLAVTNSLRNICSSMNKLDRYLISETIGSRLFESDKISKAELQEALKAKNKNGNSLQYNIGALNLVDESVLTQCLAQQYKNCRTVNLSSIKKITENILHTIPEKYVGRYQVLPFKSEHGKLHTATMDPNNWQILNEVQFISGYSVVPYLASEYHLLNSIEKFYKVKADKPTNHEAMSGIQNGDWNSGLELVEEKQESIAYNEELKDSDAPIIKLANVIIEEAIKQKASDIHIEPYENELRVRLRIDGTLITVLNPSRSYANGLASRIKIMSGLDISEKRLPQDGRFKARKNGNIVDFRVSTFPGIFGEKIVLRLLDNSNLVLDINKLGLNNDDLTTLLSAMYKSKGMVLITGPTGSGKTTTIYSMLHDLNDGTRNIATAEDPIEYNLKGINQFQMNAKIGLNFAHALRTFLRQDPDIIMVGEIRDLETAEIAFKAALTGHLVLSTLHTNNAPETITRLINIGIEPYMITSSVNLIVAQRLIRKICEKCKIEVTPTDLQTNVLRNYGFNIKDHHFAQGEGCEECNNTGYKGRIAIYEVMPLWDEIKELILKGNSAFEIRTRAEEKGLTSLQMQGFNKVITGVTSLNEWIRVLA